MCAARRNESLRIRHRHRNTVKGSASPDESHSSAGSVLRSSGLSASSAARSKSVDSESIEVKTNDWRGLRTHTVDEYSSEVFDTDNDDPTLNDLSGDGSDSEDSDKRLYSIQECDEDEEDDDDCDDYDDDCIMRAVSTPEPTIRKENPLFQNEQLNSYIHRQKSSEWPMKMYSVPSTNLTINPLFESQSLCKYLAKHYTPWMVPEEENTDSRNFFSNSLNPRKWMSRRTSMTNIHGAAEKVQESASGSPSISPRKHKKDVHDSSSSLHKMSNPIHRQFVPITALSSEEIRRLAQAKGGEKGGERKVGERKGDERIVEEEGARADSISASNIVTPIAVSASAKRKRKPETTSEIHRTMSTPTTSSQQTSPKGGKLERKRTAEELILDPALHYEVLTDHLMLAAAEQRLVDSMDAAIGVGLDEQPQLAPDEANGRIGESSTSDRHETTMAPPKSAEKGESGKKDDSFPASAEKLKRRVKKLAHSLESSPKVPKKSKKVQEDSSNRVVTSVDVKEEARKIEKRKKKMEDDAATATTPSRRRKKHVFSDATSTSRTPQPSRRVVSSGDGEISRSADAVHGQ